MTLLNNKFLQYIKTPSRVVSLIVISVDTSATNCSNVNELLIKTVPEARDKTVHTPWGEEEVDKRCNTIPRMWVKEDSEDKDEDEETCRHNVVCNIRNERINRFLSFTIVASLVPLMLLLAVLAVRMVWLACLLLPQPTVKHFAARLGLNLVHLKSVCGMIVQTEKSVLNYVIAILVNISLQHHHQQPVPIVQTENIKMNNHS